jgi:excisionase family DNA binding protein
VFASLTFARALGGDFAVAVGVRYEIPAELIERVAERAAELLSQQTRVDDAWLDVGEAAEYLRCPTSRIYALTSAGKIPHHHDGARLLFRRSELDEWVECGGARRS